MGTFNCLTDRTVKEISAICPGVNLYYLDYLTGAWAWLESQNQKSEVSNKDKTEYAKKTAHHAESLWNLLNDKRFSLPPVHIRNSIDPIDLKLVFWILEKIAKESKFSYEMYRKGDGRKRLSVTSRVICDTAQLIERAGGAVDSRPNGQLVRIVGILAEVAGKEPPDRSSIRDVIERGYARYDKEYWDGILASLMGVEVGQAP